MKLGLLCALYFAVSTAWAQAPSPQEASARLRSLLSTGQLTEAAGLVDQIQRDPSFPTADTDLLMLQGALYQEQTRRGDVPPVVATGGGA